MRFDEPYSTRLLNRLSVDFDSCFAVDDFEISCDPHVATLGDCEDGAVPKAEGIIAAEEAVADVRCEVVCEGDVGEADAAFKSTPVTAPG